MRNIIERINEEVFENVSKIDKPQTYPEKKTQPAKIKMKITTADHTEIKSTVR